MSNDRAAKPISITASERRTELIDLLARGVVRMHARRLIHSSSDRQFSGVNNLDVSREIGLSVSERPHQLTPATGDTNDA